MEDTAIKVQERVVEFAKDAGRGLAVGTSDAIPGYSGGTTIALLGLYTKIIDSFKAIFKPTPYKSRTSAFAFLIPFIVGWGCGIVLIAKLIKLALEHEGQVGFVVFIVIFVLLSIPSFMKRRKPKFKTFSSFLSFFIGAGIVVGIGLIAKLGYGGINVAAPGAHETMSTWKYIGLFFVAMLSGSAMLLPGISGALIVLILGYYGPVYGSIIADPLNNLGGLAIFGSGVLIGIILNVVFISKFVMARTNDFYTMSVGFLLGSVFTIVYSQHSLEVGGWKGIMWIIAAVVLAVFLAFLLWVNTIKIARKVQLPKMIGEEKKKVHEIVPLNETKEITTKGEKEHE